MSTKKNLARLAAAAILATGVFAGIPGPANAADDDATSTSTTSETTSDTTTSTDTTSTETTDTTTPAPAPVRHKRPIITTNRFDTGWG